MVTAADMAGLFMVANSAAKRISGSGKMRVSPESGEKGEGLDNGCEDNGSSRLSLEGIDEGFPVPEFKYRLVSCRSRKPLLETIKEEPVCSR